MRSVYGDHKRFVETYFSTYPGQVFHRRRLPPRRGRLLLDHRPRRRRDQRRPAIAWAPRKSKARWSRTPKVAEAAVVGYPHDIKGQGIYAYVTLNWRARSRPTSCARNWSAGCASEIGPIATPDLIQWAPGLPKTRSGKIMRRILRKIAANEHGGAGRYLDAGRSRGGRRSRDQSDEPRLADANTPCDWGGSARGCRPFIFARIAHIRDGCNIGIPTGMDTVTSAPRLVSAFALTGLAIWTLLGLGAWALVGFGGDVLVAIIEKVFWSDPDMGRLVGRRRPHHCRAGCRPRGARLGHRRRRHLGRLGVAAPRRQRARGDDAGAF